MVSWWEGEAPGIAGLVGMRGEVIGTSRETLARVYPNENIKI